MPIARVPTMSRAALHTTIDRSGRAKDLGWDAICRRNDEKQILAIVRHVQPRSVRRRHQRIASRISVETAGILHREVFVEIF